MDSSVSGRADDRGRLAVDEPTFTGGATAPRFGINLDVGHVPIYANIIRHCAWFCPADNPNASTNVPLDSSLCPTTDFSLSIPLVETAYGPDGDTYPIRFVGRASLTCSLGGGTIVNQAYDPQGNVTTALLALPPAVVDRLVWINFRQTRRLPGDTTATGIDARTLTIMRPIAPGSSQHHDPSEKFNRQLGVALAPWRGGYFRTLDCRFTNNVSNVPPITPASRTPPYSPLQCPLGPSQGNSPTRGMCYEDCVELANFLGVDLWDNFEDTGTDDLFQLYLNICKFGSDAAGVAYTGSSGANPVPASGPVHPPLAGRLIWEEENENWNASFTQCGRYNQRGYDNRAALNANGELDGPNPPGTAIGWQYAQVAADLLRHADLARETFPGGLGTRYCPIYSSQSGNDPTLTQGLTWLKRHLALRGETVAQNIIGAGGDTYEALQGDVNDPSLAATPESITSLITSGIAGRQGAPYTPVIVGPYGITPTSYEGGLATYDTPLGLAAQHDPRFTALVRDRVWNLVDCGYGYISEFSLIAGCWSLLDTIHDLTHPKWLGWSAAIAAYPMDGRSPVPRPAASAPYFADPSFELVRLPQQSGQVRYNPTGSPWTFNGGAGINGPDSGFLNPGQPVPLGTQVAFLQGSASISQVVSGFTPGGIYVIGIRAVGWIGQPSTGFDVLVDGAVIGTFTPAASTYFGSSSAPFTASATTHTIAFRTTATAGNRAVMLDALSITPMPAAVPSIRPSIHGGAAGLKGAVGMPAY